jgi:phosphoglycerate dehydrogenase-like enzyme
MTPTDARTVGLVGIGNIGTVFAEAFLGKGLTVVGTN